MEASVTAAAAESVGGERECDMSEFAGESASSGQQMAVAYYAAAYACAERKDYEIPESGGGAVCHFSYGGSVGVVADDGSEPGAAKAAEQQPKKYKITCRNKIAKQIGGVDFKDGVGYTFDGYAASWFAAKDGYTVERAE